MDGRPRKSTHIQGVARKRANLFSIYKIESQESGGQLLLSFAHRRYLSSGIRAQTMCVATEVGRSLFQTEAPAMIHVVKGGPIHAPRPTCIREAKVGINGKGC